MFGFDSSLQSERSELISQIKILRGDSKQFQSIFDEKMKEIEPLQQALGKMRNNRSGICSSEEELNDVVCYRSPSCFLIQNSRFTRVVSNSNTCSLFSHCRYYFMHTDI